MAAESRGTEAVLNALILVSYDAQNGQLSADARAAFANMWALQQTEGDEKGSWAWLQFGSEPWEAYDSRYYGASLVAVAVGTAPMNYRATPEIQNNIKLLREYLNREYRTQSPINQVMLLWASSKLPGLLEHGKQEAIINEVLSRQQADGGWSLSSLVGTWKRRDGTPLVMKSDGYATGLITFALQQAGISREDIRVKRGLTWLVRNQSIWNGHWVAYSLNKRRHNPFSDVARFMDDAATAYAVLALTQGHQ
jgi:squalene-hopene/tetraprenyl-beta-curcumene cyclase